MNRKLYLAFIEMVCFTSLVAQNHTIDSIKTVLNTPLSDSARVETLCDLSWEYRVAGYTHEAIDSGKIALHKAEKIGFRGGQIRSSQYIGLGYAALTYYDSAFVMYKFALAHADTLSRTSNKGQVEKSQRFQAKINGNMGNLFNAMGQYPKAISCFSNALKIFEQMHDTLSIGQTYSNIGDIYFSIRKYGRAWETYSEAEQLLRNKSDRDNQLNYAKALSGMGAAKRAEGQYASALEFQLKSKEIRENQSSGFDIALSYNALGVFYGLLPDSACKIFNLTPQERYDSALYYDRLSLSKFRAFNRKREECNALITIGDVYVKMKDFTNAKLYYSIGDSLIKSMPKPDLKLLRDFYLSLSEFYRAQGNFEQAFSHLTSWKTYNDSMSLKETRDQVSQLYAIELAERKVYGDSIRNATLIKVKDETIREQEDFQKTLKVVLFVVSVILLLTTTFLIIFSRRRRLLVGTVEELKEEFTPTFRQLNTLGNALVLFSRRRPDEETKIILSEFNKWKDGFNQGCNLHIKLFEQGLLLEASSARNRMRKGTKALKEMLIKINNSAIRALILGFEEKLEAALQKFEDTESKALSRRRILLIGQVVSLVFQFLLMAIGGLVQYYSSQSVASLYFSYGSMLTGIINTIVTIFTLRKEPYKMHGGK